MFPAFSVEFKTYQVRLEKVKNPHILRKKEPQVFTPLTLDLLDTWSQKCGLGNAVCSKPLREYQAPIFPLLS